MRLNFTIDFYMWKNHSIEGLAFIQIYCGLWNHFCRYVRCNYMLTIYLFSTSLLCFNLTKLSLLVYFCNWNIDSPFSLHNISTTFKMLSLDSIAVRHLSCTRTTAIQFLRLPVVFWAYQKWSLNSEPEIISEHCEV